MKPKTTVQLVDEALARRGLKRLHLEPAPLHKPAKAKKQRKNGDNGRSR